MSAKDTLVRRLALERVRELRRIGWSFREIGRRFHARSDAALDGCIPPPRHEDFGAAVAGDERAVLRALDAVDQALALFDVHGMLLHVNRPLRQVLSEAPEGKQLQGEILRFAGSLCSSDHPRREALNSKGEANLPGTPDALVEWGGYWLRGRFLEPGLLGLGCTLLITLQRRVPSALTDEELFERFGLSRQEIRIARLLAEGRSNAQIAAMLGISPHTARRHTEHVFTKVGARSRAAVGRKLLSRAPDRYRK